MCPGSNNLVGKVEVVVQGVQRLAWVGKVAGVAHANLGQSGAGLAHCLDGRNHLVNIVQSVEDTEDVHTGFGSLENEGSGDLFRVRGVANGVATAQQHLDADVWQCCTNLSEAIPWVLPQESKRHVICRTSPGFDGE